MDGRIVNGNHAIIARAIWESGLQVSDGISVGDTVTNLCAAMARCQQNADVVVCTGGLGPTEDDRTISALCAMAGLPCIRYPEVERHLRDFYQARCRTMPESNLKQADLPEGSIILPNRTGTAVGVRRLVTHFGRSVWWILLPGVSREMNAMLGESVIPFLKTKYATVLDSRQLHTFKCVGVGESELSERLAPIYPLDYGMTIRFQIPFPEVHIQLCASSDVSPSQFEALRQQIYTAIEDCCYTQGPTNFASVIVNQLTADQLTLAVAESCTGGRVAQMITAVPGSSAVLMESIVAYHNRTKIERLGVSDAILDTHGAVSEPVAMAMADGVRLKLGAAIGLSITGIAGPGGGSDTKPVGMVCIGISIDTHPTSAYTHYFAGEREQIQLRAATHALITLWKQLGN
jgi:nicotinamide-nucleotide amidase